MRLSESTRIYNGSNTTRSVKGYDAMRLKGSETTCCK